MTGDCKSRNSDPVVGIVIPCFNEEQVIPRLIESLSTFLDSLLYSGRVIFVNDGSTDATGQLLDAACAADARFGCLHFSRNFGHQLAVSAGLAVLDTDAVCVLDADLQDPPEALLEMLQRWKEGYDVVYGVRRNRKEGLLLRTAYAGYYRLLKYVSNVDLPLDAGDFCVMDRRVVTLLNEMPEHNRFVRGLRAWVGFRQIGVEYDRQARAAGKSKYSLPRLSKLALDGLIGFSLAPLRLAIWLGVAASVMGFGLLVWAVAQALFYKETPSGWASLAVMILFFGGIQLLMLGIIGEYVGRIFDEVKQRPNYVISSISGWAQCSRAMDAESIRLLPHGQRAHQPAMLPSQGPSTAADKA